MGTLCEPLIDVVYETTDEEDEYDRRCLDRVLAEPSDPVSFEDLIAELGFTRDDLNCPDCSGDGPRPG